MKIIRGQIKEPLLRPALTIGNFDGVHLGHQKILELIREQARKQKGASVVYTFDPHPAKIMAPDVDLRLIQTMEQRIEKIAVFGIAVCIIEPFTGEFAEQSPEDFFNLIILKKIAPVQVVAGYDLTFGRKRLGTVDLMKSLCLKNGIDFSVVKEVLLNNTVISSTQIRNYIADGRVDLAMQMAGSPFALIGKVVHGKGLGKKIGVHTANVSPENEILPKEGVYITKTLGHVSVTNVGYNPTFGGTALSVETHIPGFSKDIYGQKIEILFHKRLRDEKTFEGAESLAKQIKLDIGEARNYFEKYEH